MVNPSYSLCKFFTGLEIAAFHDTKPVLMKIIIKIETTLIASKPHPASILKAKSSSHQWTSLFESGKAIREAIIAINANGLETR